MEASKVNSIFNRKTLVRVCLIIFISILLLGIIDVINFDDQVHSWSHFILEQEKRFYFDLPFIQTTLSLFEIIALFSAVLAPFYILLEEQKDSKRRTELAYQPFVKASEVIYLSPYFSEPGLQIQNIGIGPALFVRIAFVETKPDNPENATLKSDQPHSQYLSSNEKTDKLLFDLRLFYKFITGTERGGELGSDSSNYNNPSLRKELNDLIKAKIGKNFFIYIHASDILGNKMIFEIKYLLCLEPYREEYYLLKRMEIQQK
ncbi:MAG: hypothetical protein AAB583_04535 [Patescibacteria group bacterium]